MAEPGRHELAGADHGPRRNGVLVALSALLAVVAIAFVGLTVFRPGAPITGAAAAEDSIDTSDRTVVVNRVPADGSTRHTRAQEQLIAAIMDDLTTFWIDALPDATGTRFTALRGGLTAMDSSAPSGSAPCVGSPAHIVGNAFYCPSSDGIIYDSSALVPVLLHRYSIGGLIATFAHEFGHAVQAQVRAASSDPAQPAGSSLLTEAQADCDAGAFLAWAAAGNAPHIQLSDAMLASAIGPIVDFSDPVDVDPDDPTAHGLAVDRLGWLLTGFRQGAATCLSLTAEELDALLGTVAVPSDPQPRYGSREALLAAAERSLTEFGSTVPAARADSDLLDRTEPYGQVAQATVLAIAVGTDVTGSDVGAACFAGAWIGSIFGSAAPGELGSWPGDADEGLDAVRLSPGASFDSAAAYVDGFRHGRSVCG